MYTFEAHKNWKVIFHVFLFALNIQIWSNLLVQQPFQQSIAHKVLFLQILYNLFQLLLCVAYVIVDDDDDDVDDDDDDIILDTFSCDSLQSIRVIIVCCVCDSR